MAVTWAYIYEVTGHRPFPTDMLRYDDARPSRETDSTAIDRSFFQHFTRRQADQQEVRVQLRGTRPPTAGRWESFGWYVDSGAGILKSRV